jgi:hypothetical protein
MRATRALRLCGLAALLAAGCGGKKAEQWSGASHAAAPWDRALVPPEEPGLPADWAEGRVASVSEDAKTVEVRIERGEVREGEQLSIFLVTKDVPSPHYWDSEMRELRVATGRVVSVTGDLCQAEITELALRDDPRDTARSHGDDRALRAPVSPGDRVVVRTP